MQLNICNNSKAERQDWHIYTRSTPSNWISDMHWTVLLHLAAQHAVLLGICYMWFHRTSRNNGRAASAAALELHAAAVSSSAALLPAVRMLCMHPLAAHTATHPAIAVRRQQQEHTAATSAQNTVTERWLLCTATPQAQTIAHCHMGRHGGAAFIISIVVTACCFSKQPFCGVVICCCSCSWYLAARQSQ